MKLYMYASKQVTAKMSLDMRAFCANRVVFPWRVFYFSASTPGDAQDWIDIICWKIASNPQCFAKKFTYYMKI